MVVEHSWEFVSILLNLFLYLYIIAVPIAHGVIVPDINSINTVVQQARTPSSKFGFDTISRFHPTTHVVQGRELVGAALSSPLQDINSMKDANRVLLSVTGGPDAVSLERIQSIIAEMRKQVNNETFVLFGATTDQKMADAIKLSFIVTGIPSREFKKKNSAISSVAAFASKVDPKPKFKSFMDAVITFLKNNW